VHTHFAAHSYVTLQDAVIDALLTENVQHIPLQLDFAALQMKKTQ
jgi:hypothetical protein